MNADNLIPLADGEMDQAATVNFIVTLDGSGSSDPDGMAGDPPLSFAWSITAQPVGSLASLDDDTAVMPSFIPDLVGTYAIQLIVTDHLGAASLADEVVVSTVNTAPVADAGADQFIILLGTVVMLDGSQSFDLDGDPITFLWSLDVKPAGSAASLSDPTVEMPTFVADVQGTYVVSLEVTDDFPATSAPDDVSVSFNNVAPVADAGNNQMVLVSETVFLSGSGSDANGDLLTFSWMITSKPAGSTAMLDDSTSQTPSFLADLEGTYTVSLVVNDGLLDSSPASVMVTALTAQTNILNKLADILNAINALPTIVFKNANMQNTLGNKINATVDMINDGLFQDALDKLENDILTKTNGCADTGAPDKNDWINDCPAQGLVYPIVIDAIALIQAQI